MLYNCIFEFKFLDLIQIIFILSLLAARVSNFFQNGDSNYIISFSLAMISRLVSRYRSWLEFLNIAWYILWSARKGQRHWRHLPIVVALVAPCLFGFVLCGVSSPGVWLSWFAQKQHLVLEICHLDWLQEYQVSMIMMIDQLRWSSLSPLQKKNRYCLSCWSEKPPGLSYRLQNHHSATRTGCSSSWDFWRRMIEWMILKILMSCLSTSFVRCFARSQSWTSYLLLKKTSAV